MAAESSQFEDNNPVTNFNTYFQLTLNDHRGKDTIRLGANNNVQVYPDGEYSEVQQYIHNRLPDNWTRKFMWQARNHVTYGDMSDPTFYCCWMINHLAPIADDGKLKYKTPYKITLLRNNRGSSCGNLCSSPVNIKDPNFKWRWSVLFCNNFDLYRPRIWTVKPGPAKESEDRWGDEFEFEPAKETDGKTAGDIINHGDLVKLNILSYGDPGEDERKSLGSLGWWGRYSVGTEQWGSDTNAVVFRFDYIVFEE